MAYLITEMLKLILQVIGYGLLALAPLLIIVAIVTIQDSKKKKERERLQDEALRKYLDDYARKGSK